MNGEPNAAGKLDNFPHENPPTFRILKPKPEGMAIDPKYIFDPKNPEACGPFLLLRQLMKNRSSELFVDPVFLAEFFQEEIKNDQSFLDGVWNRPENFSELDGVSLANMFINQHSQKGYFDLLRSKNLSFQDLGIGEFFASFNQVPNDNVDEVGNYKAISDNYFKEFNKGQDSKGTFSKAASRVLFVSPRFFNLFLQNRIVRPSIIVLIKVVNEEKTWEFDSDKQYLKILSSGKEISFRINAVPLILNSSNDLWDLLNAAAGKSIRAEIYSDSSQVLTSPIIVNRIFLKSYFSLNEIEIADLSKSKEIFFLGGNGEGKTLLLQAIALALKGNPNHWKGIKTVGHITDILRQNTSGEMVLEAETDQGTYRFNRNLSETALPEVTVLGYGIGRFRNDSRKLEESGIGSLFSTDQYLESPEEWLKYLDHKEARNEPTPVSPTDAISMLEDLILGEVEIKMVGTSVEFRDGNRTFNFDQLSDGLKSVLIWACDMVARLAKAQPRATRLSEFCGIVLVDEIEAFLHPTWQYQIIGKLRAWFPKIQWIFTTHSPVVVLGASEDAVFNRVYKEDGETRISQPVKNVRSLTANTVLTSPLFGLESPKVKGTKAWEVDTNDFHIAKIIHQEIAERVKDLPVVTEKELMDMVNEELDKLMQEEK